MGCTDALLTMSHHLQMSLDIGMESYIVQLGFNAAFDRVSHSGLLFKLKSIVVGGSVLSGSSSLTAGRESWLMVLLVSGFQSFLACHRAVCRVLFNSAFIPMKYLSCWRTDYMPLVMTPHYWQLFASQQTDLLLLPPLTGTWLGLRSGAITGARY